MSARLVKPRAARSAASTPVGRRFAGVQRLAHGAEQRLQPGGPGSGDAERSGGGGGIQFVERAGGRGGAERAQGCGGVPSRRVVARPGVAAEDALGVHAGAERRDGFGAGPAPMLGQRQHHGRHRHGGVAGHCEMNVVVVVRMAGGAVEPGRLANGSAVRPADKHSLGMAAVPGYAVGQYIGKGLPRSGHGDPYEVHERLLANGSGLRWNRFIIRSGDALGQLPGCLHVPPWCPLPGGATLATGCPGCKSGSCPMSNREWGRSALSGQTRGRGERGFERAARRRWLSVGPHAIGFHRCRIGLA